MSNQLSTISFHGQTLLTTIQDDVVYTALKPICENIGLSWNAQFERIKRDEVLSEGIRMIRTPTKGGFQDVVCLPLTLLNGWLFGVDTNRVKAEIKETLITYKKECYQALFDYWHDGVAINPRRHTISVEQQAQIRQAVKAKCQSNKLHYQALYHHLYYKFGVKSYKDILAVDFEQALAFIYEYAFYRNRNINFAYNCTSESIYQNIKSQEQLDHMLTLMQSMMNSIGEMQARLKKQDHLLRSSQQLLK